MGDVVLVSGNARISHIVKILTLSPWSHVVLYVGNRPDLLTEEQKEEYTQLYGNKACEHLVVDADPLRGVHLRPLDEWSGLMLRHCRPTALRRDDRDQVVDYCLAQLGKKYDRGHIIRLLFFFAFPWDLLPQSLRRIVTDFELSESDTICSRVLAEAFHSVGYPIRPTLFVQNRGSFHSRILGTLFGRKRRITSSFRLLFGGRWSKAIERISDKRYVEIQLSGTRHLTPSDYDLSRFFSIIKDPDDGKVNYRDARVSCSWGLS